jgi:hypothetical protein
LVPSYGVEWQDSILRNNHFDILKTMYRNLEIGVMGSPGRETRNGLIDPVRGKAGPNGCLP